MKILSRDLSQHVTKDVLKSKTHVKQCSHTLVIRKMQIKISVRYHYTSKRIKCKRSDNTKCWQGYGITGILKLCWQEGYILQLVWETIGQCLLTLKTQKKVKPSSCSHRDTPDRAAHLCAPKVCIEWSHLRVPSWRRHQCPWIAECSMFKWIVVQLHSTVFSLRKMSELFIYKTT